MYSKEEKRGVSNSLKAVSGHCNTKQTVAIMVSNGHSAPLSSTEYDPGLMQKAQGQLTQGQKENYGALKSRYGGG